MSLRAIFSSPPVPRLIHVMRRWRLSKVASDLLPWAPTQVQQTLVRLLDVPENLPADFDWQAHICNALPELDPAVAQQLTDVVRDVTVDGNISSTEFQVIFRQLLHVLTVRTVECPACGGGLTVADVPARVTCGCGHAVDVSFA